MPNSGHSNGAGASRPVDTVASLRALGDVQRRGLDAANEIIGRLLEPSEREEQPFGADPSGPSSRPRSADPFAEFAELMRAGFEAMLETLTKVASPQRRVVSVPDGISTDAVVLEPVAPGGESAGELWLHNRGGSDVAAVRLHSGGLRTHHGWAIPAERISFSPNGDFELPDRTSRGVRIIVEVDEDTAPGVYRGTVLAANLPELWLPVELIVTAEQ